MKPDQLTDEQIKDAWNDCKHSDGYPVTTAGYEFARAIEAARDAQWEAMLAEQKGVHNVHTLAQPAPQQESQNDSLRRFAEYIRRTGDERLSSMARDALEGEV